MFLCNICEQTHRNEDVLDNWIQWFVIEGININEKMKNKDNL